MAQYGKKEYWEERYSKDPEPFDWFQHYSGIRALVTQYVKPQHRILIPGCGNSRLGEDLVADGYTDVIGVDFSPVVIKQMKDRYKDTKGLTYQLMDVTKMDFANDFFDAIIDKAMVDSLLCGEGSQKIVQQTINEYMRTLKPGGVCLIVTYAPPEQRMMYYERAGQWTITPHTVPKPPIQPDGAVDDKEVHYVYVCRKTSAAS
eukprot:EC715670.1.p1 GENE.EC715670.1~~EC715670.1.p1  ORF type:complete len:203 (+),score=45.91 EC715670.1:45-653(+)